MQCFLLGRLGLAMLVLASSIHAGDSTSGSFESTSSAGGNNMYLYWGGGPKPADGDELRLSSPSWGESDARRTVVWTVRHLAATSSAVDLTTKDGVGHGLGDLTDCSKPGTWISTKHPPEPPVNVEGGIMGWSELFDFYNQRDKTKLTDIPLFLTQYSPADLQAALFKKYGESPAPSKWHQRNYYKVSRHNAWPRAWRRGFSL